MKKIMASLFCLSASCNVYAANENIEFELLKEQLNLLQDKINNLEKKQEKTTKELYQNKVNNLEQATKELPQTNAPNTFDTAPLQPKHWQIPGTATQVSITGFIKLTGTKDISGSTALEGDNTSLGRHFLCARNLGLDNDPSIAASKDIYMHARESRFAINTFSPIDNDAVKTCLEMDFLGDRTSASVVANGYDLRLRKAYVEFKGFLIGQNFTTFSDTATFGETIDANGPIGNCQIRQPQIRYSYTDATNNKFEVALENTESGFITPKGELKGTGSSSYPTNVYNENIKGENRLPDLIAAYTFNDNWGYVKLAGLMCENAVKTKADNSTHKSIGGAAAIYGMINLSPEDKLTLQVAYGSGAGRYFTEALNAATYFDNHKLHNNKAFRSGASFMHNWSTKHNIRSTMAVAYMKNTNCDEMLQNMIKQGEVEPTIAQAQARAINKHIMSVHANLIGNVNAMTQVGLEYIFAKRKAETGESGKLHRINLAVQVNF